MRIRTRADATRVQAIVNDVVHQRGVRLNHPSLQPSTHLAELGRLLAFLPEHTLSDGAASFATCAFFDDHNIPSWDTWLGFIVGDWFDLSPQPTGPIPTSRLSALICWIPNDILSLANAGIEANPEECILWADQLGNPSIDSIISFLNT